MESEVNTCMKQGMSLEEAMQEWDIYPYDLHKV
jgi:predicted RNase H-like HicB family nuclease